MTSVSLLETLDTILPPIKKAEQAIREDSLEKLRPLLTHSLNQTNQTEDLLTENSYTNPQIRENLLHFAVHQSAGSCVNLLVNSPYSWNPDLVNTFNFSPYRLAIDRGYLPCLYPLATHSSKKYEYNSNNVTVSLYLIDPVGCDELITYHPDRLIDYDQYHIFEVQVRDQVDTNLTAQNLVLFLELMLSENLLSKIDQTNPSKLIWNYLMKLTTAGEEHVKNCTNFPQCLSNIGTPRFIDHWHDQNNESTSKLLLQIWAAHRLVILDNDDDDGTDSHAELDHEKDNVSTLKFGPLSLMSLCRIVIRRLILSYIRNQNKSVDENLSNPHRNYANCVLELPIAPKLKAFLSYYELWPNLDRKLIRTRKFHRPIPLILNGHAGFFSFNLEETA